MRRDSMAIKDKIDLSIFKIITRAVIGSYDLDVMANQLAQLLVGTMEIKGCTIFVLNPETDELEVLTSFGLSTNYMNKGPVSIGQSIGWTSKIEPIVISDITKSDRLQYLENAKEEGIGAIVSLPITYHSKIIGALRLYHYETWDVSDVDLDSLSVLAKNIGRAMISARIFNAFQSVKDTVNEVHTIWLEPKEDK
jgi:signal transduction protein with GAF and PtsI domain